MLEGLAVALSNVDEMIALIKASPTPAEAKRALDGARLALAAGVETMFERAPANADSPARGLAAEFGLHRSGYRLSDVQAQRILEMRLQRLTGLEQDKIAAEYKEMMDNIADLLDILAQARAHHGRSSRDELERDQGAVRRQAPQ